MQKTIYLHAGAHRTGTSSFQNCLAENRALLRQTGHDLAYPGRDGIASGKLRLKLPDPRHGPRKVKPFVDPARNELARHCGDKPALILSEENIPGRMYHFYQGAFFPAAKARAQVLAQALPGRVAHLIYVLRPYEKIYVSAYRKRAEDNPVDPFDGIRPNLMAMDRGWPELVEILRDALQPTMFTVLEYGARGRSVDLLKRLVPTLNDQPLTEPERVLNLSATDAALLDLQARYRAGEKLDRSAWQDVIQTHSHDNETRGFAAFSTEESQRLQDRYQQDLDRIDMLDGMRLVRQ